jgi:hypothetical protein
MVGQWVTAGVLSGLADMGLVGTLALLSLVFLSSCASSSLRTCWGQDMAGVNRMVEKRWNCCPGVSRWIWIWWRGWSEFPVFPRSSNIARSRDCRSYSGTVWFRGEDENNFSDWVQEIVSWSIVNFLLMLSPTKHLSVSWAVDHGMVVVGSGRADFCGRDGDQKVCRLGSGMVD